MGTASPGQTRAASRTEWPHSNPGTAWRVWLGNVKKSLHKNFTVFFIHTATGFWWAEHVAYEDTNYRRKNGHKLQCFFFCCDSASFTSLHVGICKANPNCINRTSLNCVSHLMFTVRDHNHSRQCSLLRVLANWEMPGSTLDRNTDHPDTFRGTA